MTLTLQLSSEMERWLREEAAKNGVDTSEYARRLIESSRHESLTSLPISEEERLAAIDAAMGAFAHVSTSSEDFARRKQDEINLEDSKFTRNQGQPK